MALAGGEACSDELAAAEASLFVGTWNVNGKFDSKTCSDDDLAAWLAGNGCVPIDHLMEARGAGTVSTSACHAGILPRVLCDALIRGGSLRAAMIRQESTGI